LANNKIDIKEAKLEGQSHDYYIIFYPIFNHNSFMTTWQNGMVVYINNSSFKPDVSDGIYIDYGKLLSISVKRTFTQNYPYP
jgi:hypothetical protein